MKHYLQKSILFILVAGAAHITQAQTTNTYTTSTTWTVPAGVTSVSIKVYGGGGGTGGQDCGAGCSNAAAGNAGYVLATYTVSPGNSIGIYPGGKGTNGANSITGTGGGSGGTSSYAAAYNGGAGGNAGSSGSSGGGGGGGAASIVTINSVIKIIAGGASGGGGMANMANSGYAGNNTYAANGTSNTGGNGTSAVGDGGGGGGGGGGQYGSLGGGVHAAGGETAGDGGSIGGNSVTGASVVTTNGNIAWTNAGQVQVTYTVVVPVTWLSFSSTRQTSGAVLLNWSTASEINSRSFLIQRSGNGSDWTDIGTVAAAGSSSSEKYYNYSDAQAGSGINYYRLIQSDMDGRTSYSKILVNRPAGTSNIKLFPNPVTDGTATITLKTAGRVVVYNGDGIKMLQKDFPAGSSLLNVSQYSKGTYYIKTGEGRIAFVIQ